MADPEQNEGDWLDEILNSDGSSTSSTAEKTTYGDYSETELRQLYRAGVISEAQWHQELVDRGNSDSNATTQIARQKTIGVSTSGGLTASEQRAADALKGQAARETPPDVNGQPAMFYDPIGPTAAGPPMTGPENVIPESQGGPTNQAAPSNGGGVSDKPKPPAELTQKDVYDLVERKLMTPEEAREELKKIFAGKDPRLLEAGIQDIPLRQPAALDRMGIGPTAFNLENDLQFGRTSTRTTPGGDQYDLPNVFSRDSGTNQYEGLGYANDPITGLPQDVPATVTVNGQTFYTSQLPEMLRQRGIYPEKGLTIDEALNTLDASLRYQKNFQNNNPGLAAGKFMDAQKAAFPQTREWYDPKSQQVRDLVTPEGIQKWTSGLDASIPQRERGGPVQAGEPYVVGERGPEVMVPSTDGMIRPNQLSRGSRGGFNQTPRASIINTGGMMRPYQRALAQIGMARDMLGMMKPQRREGRAAYG